MPEDQLTEGAESIAVSTPIGTKEACLDLLLAEDLTVDMGFAEHLVRPALNKAGLDAPAGPPEKVVVTFNYWHQIGDDAKVFGENDLDIMLTWSDGTTNRVLLEDKVRSSLQPTQAQRYRARADACGAAAIIVAPEDWLASQPASVAFFHSDCSIEELAEVIRARGEATARSAWRASLLEALAKKPIHGSALDDEPTIAFRDYCVDRLREHAPTAEVYLNFLHTANQGWLELRRPSGLTFKASHGRVDLTVKYQGFTGTVAELEALLAAHPSPEGFVPATDTLANVVLRHLCPVLNPGAGVPHETTALDQALDACVRLIEWIDGGGSTLLAASAPTRA